MTAVPISTSGLAALLRERVTGQVLDDRGHQAVYAHDASNHRVLPQVVVLPETTDDVLAVLAACRETGTPLTSRGAGTNIAGNAIGAGVVIDFSRHLDRIVDVDVDERIATVQPGVVLDCLQRQLAPHGLRFGPDPSSHDRCTIGGMVGTNACGSHSVAWGTTAASVRSADVALADGRVVRLGRGSADAALLEAVTTIRDSALSPIRAELGRFPRQVSGYGLQHLLPEHSTDLARAFVGSEGTLGVLLEAEIELVERPRHQALVVAGYPSLVAAAAAAAPLRAGSPLTIEALGSEVVAAFDRHRGPNPRPTLPPGRAWLLVEAGGASVEEARARADELSTLARQVGSGAVEIVTEPADQRALWRIRERGAGLASRTADGRESWPGWEDAAVPPGRLASYVTEFESLLAAHDLNGVIYGHFGDGCVHVRIDYDLRTDAGRAVYRGFQEAAAELVVRHGGVPSGEHGDGRARSELLSRVYSPDLMTAFAAFKHAFDPDNLLNPGVLVDPAPMDHDLALAIARPHQHGLAFSYPEDHGDIGVAVNRCVGVGSCRRSSGGGMCPSFRATRDERHSTRGRARVLTEMLDGNLRDENWAAQEAHDALDLCLACKACSSECPVSVDMATYKAEFLHQHYRGRLRPRAHLSMGWLPTWLALARRAPRLANGAMRLPGLHRLAGIDSSRPLPRLATGRRGAAAGRPAEVPDATRTGDPVLLWVDTFTRAFSPEVVNDAVGVLTAAGYVVQLPKPDLCCGLTWVTTGQLGIAKRVMRRTVRALATYPDLPVVTLEPSCGSALRDDLPVLLDTDAARQLGRRVVTFAQSLQDRELDLRPVSEDVVAQFHCHQRATSGTSADLEVLRRAGVTPTTVDEGCCGLAGSFGFEPGHAEVSRTCAEQSFVPVLDAAGDDAVVLADGFSCKLQIEQVSGRRSRHLAQLLRAQLR